MHTYKETAMVIIPDKTIHPSHILWFMGCNVELYKRKILWANGSVYRTGNTKETRNYKYTTYII